MPPTYLIIPGWSGSGPSHWQSHWQRELPGAARVEMPDWNAPRRSDWLGALDRAVRAAAEPPILIAHSLGCIAVAHWAERATVAVRAALLVAPADVDREGCPDALRGFAPLPRARLRFRSRVVASDDDPYAAPGRSRELAGAWGSRITMLAGAGHINAAAGFGPWPEGRALLRTLEDAARSAACLV